MYLAVFGIGKYLASVPVCEDGGRGDGSLSGVCENVALQQTTTALGGSETPGSSHAAWM